MISAARFAKIHLSTWKSLTPTTDLYLKRVNGFVVRGFPPLESFVSPNRRAFINEIGFELFAAAARTEGRRTWKNLSSMEHATENARNRIRQFGDGEPGAIADPTDDERRECIELARRLHDYFEAASSGGIIDIHPPFPGCGIVDACAGDVYFDGTLCEVKAGDRAFLFNGSATAIDLRCAEQSWQRPKDTSDRLS